MLEITHLEPEKKKGLVVVITGHGKGKTTTALGIERSGRADITCVSL